MVFFLKIHSSRDFPGGPAVKTLHLHCRGRGFKPTCCEVWPKKKKRKRKKQQQPHSSRLIMTNTPDKFKMGNIFKGYLDRYLHRHPETVKVMKGKERLGNCHTGD